MSKKFPEYKDFDLSRINKEVLGKWDVENTFHRSVEQRRGCTPFIFYEGPPSANGMPGIHHVMARTIKDIFCRFKTMEGYYVERKAGWDTHGLPVELSVEKSLGISKEDIGKKISVEDYNTRCRQDVMRFTGAWEELTRKVGYWIDMDEPYITYDNRYIETLWYLLKQLFEKGLLYKGYSIQPYSPAAGTGLSTHELNQPGAYRDVKDTTCVAEFKVIRDDKSEFLFEKTDTDEVFFLAWTTTPWTLPSNTALAVGAEIRYVEIKTFNPYSGNPVTVVLAKDRLPVYFPEKNAELKMEDYKPGDKNIPWMMVAECSGKELTGIRYEQLLKWVDPGDKAFRVVTGDFVTTEDGTGIVHIAPTFGADDARVGKENDIPPLLLKDKDGILQPMVDKKGRFYAIENLDPDFVNEKVDAEAYKPFAGRYVKNEYDDSLPPDAESIDVSIVVYLKKLDRVFRIEKHVHNYPHCWRTDKPVLYYPLDSWFIKTTALRDRMIELNKMINWKPVTTGQGRFGKWLENLVDWNLSRSRYWGTPLPVWVSEDKKEKKCIGSVAELKHEIEKAIEAGFMKENPLKDYRKGDWSKENYEQFDLHRPFVDEIILVSDSGKKMFREPDLIDVWFDSGAMPYAQNHYPFATDEKQLFKKFPADFIAEGVDQTRGWFFTLHALAVMLFDRVAYYNIISNGLVLDKNGNKMSKRLGNAVDPFETIEKHGSDPLRWYMITNAQPWDNLKFDPKGLEEVKRKFFGTLYNTYSFFALYANIDGFVYDEPEVPMTERPEIDRWIVSLLNTLVKEVGELYRQYEPTRAARLIQNFIIENLSNWYVRLTRKRYWGGEYSKDKIAAYQTLYTCLETVAILAAPIAPFYMDRIFTDLNGITGRYPVDSVHLTDFPEPDESLIDKDLEERMMIAQKVSSMVLGLRRKVNIKVRQPLNKIMLPVSDENFRKKFEAVKNLILSEVNVKEVEYVPDTAEILVKRIKPDFKKLGPKYGKKMKQISAAIAEMSQEDIKRLEQEKVHTFKIDGEEIVITDKDVEIHSEDIPGWLVASDGPLTVALDITITDELREEGIARELINRIQNIRKESRFNVTDKVSIRIKKHDAINPAVLHHKKYIAAQTLAGDIMLENDLDGENVYEVELANDVKTLISVQRKS
ncbi:MAG TPA: isoleucine--tRNA ligase [Bacteroidetes bacterium]|nr:isoleucine--tRNA ligase [Bacteroidota bacterium]